MSAKKQQIKLIGEGSFKLSPLITSSARTLQIHLYLRIAGIEYDWIESAYPYSTIHKDGTLPELHHGIQISDWINSFSYLKQNISNIDEYLSRKEQSDHDAFFHSIYLSLDPATQYLLWLDNQNYYTLTSVEYAKHTPFPLSRILPFLQRREAISQQESRGIHSTVHALKQIRKCYQILSSRLGLHPYYGKHRACSLDACVAAYIATHYHTSFVSVDLKAIISNEFPNLERHFQRVLSSYFTHYQPSASLSSPLDAIDHAQTEVEQKYSANAYVPAVTAPSLTTTQSQSHPQSQSQSQSEAQEKPQSKSQTQSHPQTESTEQQQELERNNKYFVVFALSSLVGYITLRSFLF